MKDLITQMEQNFSLEPIKKNIFDIKNIGLFLWDGIKFIYKYLPITIIGFVYLYLLFQFLLVLGGTNFSWTHWAWAIDMRENSYLLCFKHAPTIWGGLAKVVIFIALYFITEFNKGFIISQLENNEYPRPVQYVFLTILIGIMYCIFNNDLYPMVVKLVLPGCIVVPILFAVIGAMFSGGSGGSTHTSSSSYEYSNSSSSQNTQKQMQEDLDNYKQEQQRKHDTIKYATDRPDGIVQMVFEDGHTRTVYGRLISFTSSHVTVHHNGFTKVYDIHGNCIKTIKA